MQLSGVPGLLMLLQLLLGRGGGGGGGANTRGLVVLVQVGLESERLVTPGALEVLRRRVRLHVGPEIRAVGEGLLAHGAGVRLVARVRPQVAL